MRACAFNPLILLCLTTLSLHAQSESPAPLEGERVATAHRFTGDAPVLDARLDEPAWRDATWVRGLTQKDPVEGLPAGELTEVAFLYNESSLYVGARLATPLTGRLRTRMGPRDDMGQTQSFFISLDTHHDHRTAYTFGVTAAGVQVDFHHPGDQELNQVLSWNPVWDVRIQVDEDHWIVEARIPFSQLRFNPLEEQVWGLQIDRWSPERNAEDYWVMIPRSETGWASRFGELRGIRGIKPSRRMELLPYFASSAELLRRHDSVDPFNDTYSIDMENRLGGDLKMGLGPNLTLDATINPDFGQVEADPAEMNLTAFETFFEERRPFFLEGDRLLRGMGPRYYYSRRIGAPPRSFALPDTITHVDLPANTTILGAVKLTGRLANGTSIGLLASATDEESAAIHNASSGRSDQVIIQPRTGSAVLRLQQDFAGTGSVVGLSLTGLHRSLDDSPMLAARLPEDAVTGGLDGYWRFKDGRYGLTSHWGFSRVNGDSLAILRVQRSPARYFQRPDQSHVHLDPGRTSLSGWTGGLGLERIAGHHWRWSTGVSTESPGLELNDLGQLSNADGIDSWLNLTWEENRGQKAFQRWMAWNNYNAGWDFGGLPLNRQSELGFWGLLQNFWTVDGTWSHVKSAFSNSLTRGDITMGTVGSNYFSLNLNSPELLRPNQIGVGSAVRIAEDHKFHNIFWLRGRFRPDSRLQITVNPSTSMNRSPSQYLATLPPAYTGLDRNLVLFSRMDYREARISARLRYAISPKLRLEYYAEPFMASIRFTDPGRPAGARSQHIERYAAEGHLANTADGTWVIDEAAGPIEWNGRDQEFASWRSTCVLQWDWRMGSTFYLVWQQDREKFIEAADADRTPDPMDALSTGGNNMIAIKISNWLPLG